MPWLAPPLLLPLLLVLLPDLAASFDVVGYLPDYRSTHVGRHMPRVGPAVTDLVLFSAELSASGDGSLDAASLKRVLPVPALMRRAKRVVLCIGGAGRSQGFQKLVVSTSARARLVQALSDLVQEHRLQGIDFDAETSLTGAGQAAGYDALLAETKVAFAKISPDLRVTVALHDWQRLGASAIAAVDRIHLMSYDYGADADDVKDGHSTLAKTQQAVRGLMDAGVPASKIAAGIPFYGIAASSGSQQAPPLTYADIVAKHKKGKKAAGGTKAAAVVGKDFPGLDRDMDDSARRGTVVVRTFNGMKTVRDKAAWAHGAGLAGCMVWELGQDTFDETSLLQAIHAGISDSPLHAKAKRALKRIESGKAGKKKKKKKATKKDEL